MLFTEHRPQFEQADDYLLVRAPAKINLYLLIKGKRDDGFHELETLMCKVTLYDELKIERFDGDGFQLVCRGEYEVPGGRDNLIWRGWELLDSLYPGLGGIKVTVDKHIPPGAGLGGGSSDAAAVVMGINKFAELGLSRAGLSELCSELGSDVAFFTGPSMSVCRGRGEKISDFSQKIPFKCLLFLSDINCSTSEVYKNYSHDSALYDSLKVKINDCIRKKNIDLLTKMCANMLEESSIKLYDDLADLKIRIERLVGRRVCISGSGSSMYSIISGQNEIEEVCQPGDIRTIGCKCITVYNNRW
jgi:4-diphosphocytidyl-2-C-methyl-D-erythritol kinase